MLHEHLSPREGGRLASLAAAHAGIPVEFLRRISDESDAFGRVLVTSLRWPPIGGWLARRAIKRARSRGQMVMTEREKALVLDSVGNLLELNSKTSVSEAAEVEARAAREVGIDLKLVWQVSQESSTLILELAAAIQPEREIPP